MFSPSPPLADDTVASIVARLTASLEHLPSIVAAHQTQMESGRTLAELRAITIDELEAVYGIAYELFNTGQFDHALPVCLQLAAHNPRDRRFLFVCASCFQQLGDFTTAAMFFELAFTLDRTDAHSMFRLAECLAALEQTDAAIKAYDTVFELGRGNFQYRHLQDQAEARIRNLRH